jgi:hypothetical protein
VPEVAIAAVIGGAALLVLGVIAASVLGPLRSLRATAKGFEEVQAETARLSRNLDVLKTRAQELQQKRTEGLRRKPT